MIGARSILPITAVCVLAGCGDGIDGVIGPDGGAQDFEWSGAIPLGGRIEIKGVSGKITAAGTSDNRVEVRATKSARRSDPSQVTIEVVEHADGVTICAVYPDIRGRPVECLPGEQGNMSTGNNDVEVDFVVSVPAGVVFVGRNVSGEVRATALQAEALISGVSGNVTITTSQTAEAATVSGSVTASIGRSDWSRDLTFTTVRGNVDVVIPRNTNAHVEASAVSGAIDSDFTLSGTATQQQGTLGSGGPTLRLSTVSGNITLRRGAAS